MPINLDTALCTAYNSQIFAGVAQLVERLLPKQNVMGSSPITRLSEKHVQKGVFFVPNISAIYSDHEPSKIQTELYP
jgi:hypothetical protein